MSGTRRNSVRRGLNTIALGIGILALAPVLSSFAVFSSGSHTHFPGESETTTIYKNGAMPAWIAAAIGGQNAETALADTSIIDSTLIAAVETEPTEPAVGEVQMGLVASLPTPTSSSRSSKSFAVTWPIHRTPLKQNR